MKYLLLGIMTALFFLNSSGQAQKPEKYGVSPTTVPTGLEVGAVAPLFSAEDQYGKKFKLKSALKKGTVVLVFFRGFWCPVCSKYLKQYADSLEMILAKDVQFVTVTPETYAHTGISKKKKKKPFTVLFDTDDEIMKLYNGDFEATKGYARKVNIFLGTNLREANEQEVAKLPVPATYIINSDGVIVWKQFDINFKNRATVQDILNNLPH